MVKKIKNPRKVGAHSPTKIAFISFPVKKRISEKIMMAKVAESPMMPEGRRDLMNFFMPDY